jgi:hypothetical protein
MLMRCALPLGYMIGQMSGALYPGRPSQGVFFLLRQFGVIAEVVRITEAVKFIYKY